MNTREPAAAELADTGLASTASTRIALAGTGEHTPEEWIETAPVADGLGVLAETIRLFREGQQ